MGKLIKEATQHVLNRAKFFTDMMDVMDSMQHSVNNYANEYVGAPDIREGFAKVRAGLYKELQKQLADAFIFSGVGGDEAEKYSREQARRVFGGNYAVMQFLSKSGQLPRSWACATEEAFRKELEEALKDA